MNKYKSYGLNITLWIWKSITVKSNEMVKVFNISKMKNQSGLKAGGDLSQTDGYHLFQFEYQYPVQIERRVVVYGNTCINNHWDNHINVLHSIYAPHFHWIRSWHESQKTKCWRHFSTLPSFTHLLDSIYAQFILVFRGKRHYDILAGKLK